MPLRNILNRLFRVDARIGDSGAVSFLEQRANVKSAVENRLAVWLGSIPSRPQYGGGLKSFSGEPVTPDLINRFRKAVTTQIERDPRVDHVRETEIEVRPDGRLLAKTVIILTTTRDVARSTVVL